MYGIKKTFLKRVNEYYANDVNEVIADVYENATDLISRPI